LRSAEKQEKVAGVTVAVFREDYILALIGFSENRYSGRPWPGCSQTGETEVKEAEDLVKRFAVG